MNCEDGYCHRAATQAFFDSGWYVALISSVATLGWLLSSTLPQSSPTRLTVAASFPIERRYDEMASQLRTGRLRASSCLRRHSEVTSEFCRLSDHRRPWYRRSRYGESGVYRGGLPENGVDGWWH